VRSALRISGVALVIGTVFGGCSRGSSLSAQIDAESPHGASASAVTCRPRLGSVTITGTLTARSDALIDARLSAALFDAKGHGIAQGEGPLETLEHRQSRAFRFTMATTRPATRCVVGWTDWPVARGAPVILRRG
jgi:hypothetical protein